MGNVIRIQFRTHEANIVTYFTTIIIYRTRNTQLMLYFYMYVLYDIIIEVIYNYLYLRNSNCIHRYMYKCVNISNVASSAASH